VSERELLVLDPVPLQQTPEDVHASVLPRGPKNPKKTHPQKNKKKKTPQKTPPPSSIIRSMANVAYGEARAAVTSVGIIFIYKFNLNVYWW